MISKSHIIALCLLLLVACGSDSDDPTGSGGDGDAIEIGLLTTLSGALGSWGPSHREAVQMAVDEINAAGGVLGRPLEIVAADTGTDPDQAVSSARELSAKEIEVMIGPTISSSTKQVATEVAIPGSVLLISPTATAGDITALEDDNLIWRTAVSDIFKGKNAARYVFASGSRRAGILFIDNIFGQGLAAEFTAEFEQLGGTVVNGIPYPELSGEKIEAYDYRIHVEAVLAGEPDLIYLITLAEDGVKISIAADARVSAAYSPRFLAEIPPPEGQLQSVGIYEGMIGLEQESSTSPNYAAFLENYQTRYQTSPEPFAEAAYDALYLLTLAMEQAESTESGDIAAHLQSVSSDGAKIGVGEFARAAELISRGQDIDYDGASGGIDFDANGDVTSGSFRVWQIQDGRFVDIDLITFP